MATEVFKAGDIALLPCGLSYLREMEVFEDERGPYCIDPCGGETDKRHIYVSEHSSWDTSLIKEFGFRKKSLTTPTGKNKQ